MAPETEPDTTKSSAAVRRRGGGSSEWRKAQNRASQKRYREKKKRLMLELESHTAEAKAHHRMQEASQLTLAGLSATSDEQPQKDKNFQSDYLGDMFLPQSPDLCPAVHIDRRQTPSPPKPRIRIVRTVLPFDLSDPFKFSGTQMTFWRKGAMGETKYTYTAEQCENQQEQTADK
ncbi:uncharacterized protein PV09_00799 [Verruconis gallopava]|uniref:BZIP domain-containing protein n=1 Tax=Verruconis gallopava TaxID=253628 RepID=A0A0D2BBX2_9PEZI|nr:uncharacterized protein PV09_00799 [Verruconis gallopava]KIW08874.1 hypothetical protein PV09_00799 [Verruconis gallopava]